MEKKTVKFISNDESTKETHWNYCKENKIPYIRISESSTEWSYVSYDLYHYNYPDSSGESILRKLMRIYESFQAYVRIPEDVTNFAGDSRKGGVFVRKEHSAFTAESLYDSLMHLETINK